MKKRFRIRITPDPGFTLLVLYLVTVVLLVLFGRLGIARAAFEEKPISPEQVRSGELLMPAGKPGKYLKAPLLSMDADIRISGITARTKLRQDFKNISNKWVEALYVFPLPGESAVDHMRMQVGTRILVGEIKEKQAAAKTYEQARKAGKKASLLAQRRPNIFTTAVANIGPGETVTIEIEYQQIITRHDNIFSLRFPMVVGPRYRPDACSLRGPTTSSVSDRRENLPARAPGTTAPDSLSFPVVTPQESPVNPIRLHVNLAAGMEISSLTSLYHGITREMNRDGSIDIRFNGKVAADRDFVLEWQPADLQTTTATLFSETKNGENYMLLMVMPPAAKLQEPLARETIFLLDTSGSMGGTSIRQAKKALRMAVHRMRPRDRFNIIAFNTTTHSLFAKAEPGNLKNLQQAEQFINGLEARGGTEIRPALELALDGRDNHERIRQVVFLTDAWVSNEEKLFQVIRNRLGDSRLFMVGIGSAPNDYFMTRASDMGRGSYTAIGKPEEVREKTDRLFTMLEQPASTDLHLHGDGLLESLPAKLPDLYSGEPLVVLLKAENGFQQLRLTGLAADRTPWQMTLDRNGFNDRPGISTLWARKKIRMLMDGLSAGENPDTVKKKVTRLALDNHLVSRYTSLVAVEQKISRPAGKNLENTRQKNNLPAGTRHELIFAGSTATATPSSLLLCIGLLLSASAGLLLRRYRV